MPLMQWVQMKWEEVPSELVSKGIDSSSYDPFPAETEGEKLLSRMFFDP